ncbi:amino acid ABC transporter permease [Sinirhodobacter populi]|uniref:Amino acid ABC transporter permease n=1 Tax=Paenirhodobacter populi TaxID=2306993 RepID=A0A443K4K4_9RHOB|nr:amino acid ABC transporter permease [Sinirhodobacter populi]RWR27680.1 amino acid ABC transporter permease [Sinirhodobacter populi]
MIPTQPSQPSDSRALSFRSALSRAGDVLFGSPLNLLLTLVSALAIWCIAGPLYGWGLRDAVWTGSAEDCRAASGACWAFIAEKTKFLMFGIYPQDERWRPATATILMLMLIAAGFFPMLWRRGRWLVWLATTGLAVWLMIGGGALRLVPTEQIGGLPLTIMLVVLVLPLSMPLGLLLALGRMSRLPLYRWLSTGVIELFRCSPLLTTLFIATVMVPFFVTEGVSVPKLLRALLAYLIVCSVYVAEALRGGLQAVPDDQRDAARSLGFGPWQALVLVVLPQAIRHALPGLLNNAVAFLKDTSLISLIGMTDFLGAIKLAGRDPAWIGFGVEGYVFAALTFFILSSILNALANHLAGRARS